LGFSCYFTAVVVFESHTVPVVPALVPVTPTAMNLPFKAAVRVNVVSDSGSPIKRQPSFGYGYNPTDYTVEPLHERKSSAIKIRVDLSLHIYGK
jgi:hypothetical protein